MIAQLVAAYRHHRLQHTEYAVLADGKPRLVRHPDRGWVVITQGSSRIITLAYDVHPDPRVTIDALVELKRNLRWTGMRWYAQKNWKVLIFAPHAAYEFGTRLSTGAFT